MSEQSKVFLSKMSEKINNGEFDYALTIPFISRELIYSSIKARIVKKIETGATPLLNEAEIKDSINDAREIAAHTALIFFHNGMLEIKDGELVLTEKGHMYVKLS